MSGTGGSETFFHIGLMTAMTLGLYLSSLYSYLLFHSLVEIVTIAVGFALFMITWNTREYLVSSYLRLLGIGYAAIAVIDLIHTLAFKGMTVFPGYGLNLPAELWLAARYLQSLTLLAAPFLVERRMANRTILGGYAVAVPLLVVMVFSGHFPDCYIEGKGLTPFKIGSEYVIVALLLASLYLFSRMRKHFDDKVFFLTAASIFCTILSELSFTAFLDMYGFANMVGHLGKLAAFYLIYRAILVTGLKDPFDLIFRELKQAEEALRKSQETLEEKVKERTAELRDSEERYRSLIHKVQTAILLYDGQGYLLASNPLAEQLLGFPKDQLLGKGLADPQWHFVREDGSVLPVAEYPVSLVLSTRQPRREQVKGICRPDRDEVIWVLVNAEPEFDEANAITRVIVSFMDITERKQAEKALQRLNRELRAIRNCNQALMRVEDEQTLLDDICHIVCDEAGYRMAWVGYAENDEARTIRPAAWAGVEDGYLEQARLTWADTERGRGPAGIVIRSGASVCIQDFAIDPKGAPWRDSALQRGYRSSICLPLKDEGATPFGLLTIYSAEPDAFTTDEIRLLEQLAGDLAFGITVLRTRLDHQRAEAQVGQLAAIVASSDDAIVGKSLDGIITTWNRGAERIYGYAQGEVLGKPIGILVPPGHEDEIPRILGRIRAGEHIEHFESMRQRKDGHTIHMSLTISPVYGPQGQVIAAAAVGRDITEKARLEEQLRQSQKMEAIGQLAGGVAHDFNNILTAIIGFGSLARMKMGADDPQRPLVDQILVASDRAAHLTQSLLAFSRKQVIIPKPVDLNTIVKSIEKLLRRLIGEDIEFTTHLAGQSLIVMADAGQVEQVLMNLVTNARDAMPGGGVLTIATEVRVLGEDFTGADGYGEPGRYALITVSDTGIGMDELTRGKIFEPFFTTKERGKGTGLGLAMAYGIVKQHDGIINVSSEPGKGTTFRIFLPLVTMEVEESQAEPGAAPPGGTETLLLAEDDQDVRALTSTVLRDFGYQVIEAVDGKDALEKYTAHPKGFELLILDVIMPRMGGKETCDAVRALRPEAKVLFISGYTADALHEKDIFQEGVQFIAKPMSPFDLLKKVRGILDGQG